MNAVAKSMESNFWDNLLFLAKARKDAVVQDTPDLLLVDSGLPVGSFNKIGRCALNPRYAAERIEAAINHFRRKETPSPFTWTIGPTPERSALEETLTGLGMVKAADTVGMVLPLKDFKAPGNTPEGLDIKRVETKQAVADFAAIVSASWKPPNPHVEKFYTDATNAILTPNAPMRLYVGYVGDKAMATAEAFYAHGGVGLTNIAASTAATGKGYAPALLLAALRDARKTGQNFAFVQADAASKAIYERIGFKPTALFSDYRLAAN